MGDTTSRRTSIMGRSTDRVSSREVLLVDDLTLEDARAIANPDIDHLLQAHVRDRLRLVESNQREKHVPWRLHKTTTRSLTSAKIVRSSSRSRRRTMASSPRVTRAHERLPTRSGAATRRLVSLAKIRRPRMSEHSQLPKHNRRVNTRQMKTVLSPTLNFRPLLSKVALLWRSLANMPLTSTTS